jgi:hypothetical protein
MLFLQGSKLSNSARVWIHLYRNFIINLFLYIHVGLHKGHSLLLFLLKGSFLLRKISFNRKKAKS